MDDILDNLGPIAIGVVYFLGWLFNKINKADETAPETQQEYDIEAEEEEYQRHVHAPNGIQPRRETGRQNTPPNLAPIPNLSKQQLQAESERAREFSWDQADDSYDNEMEVRLKKIEATKREALRLQSQSTQKRSQTKGETDRPQTTRKKSSFRSIRSSLKDPKAARSAFIYGEVLGPPVSLRKGTGVPGLTS